MTREEALVKVRGYLTDLIPSEDCDEVEEIMLALEQQPKTWNLDDAREDFMSDVYNTLDFLPTNNEANRIIDSFDRVTSGIIQQPCEDCISRQYLLDNCVVDKVTMPYVPVSKIENAPPITPQQKIGCWEYTQDDYDPNVGNWRCSECKDIVVTCLTRVAEGRIPRYKYCSNCGCRMVKPQESEDNT